VLTADLKVDHLLRLLTESALKLTFVCMTAYAASVLTLLGSAALLNQTPLGPAAVHHSFRLLTAPSADNTAAGAADPLGHSSSASETPGATSAAPGGSVDLRLLPNGSSSLVTPADLLTASLLVASLTANSSSSAEGGEAGGGDHDAPDLRRQVDMNDNFLDENRRAHVTGSHGNALR